MQREPRHEPASKIGQEPQQENRLPDEPEQAFGTFDIGTPDTRRLQHCAAAIPHCRDKGQHERHVRVLAPTTTRTELGKSNVVHKHHECLHRSPPAIH